MAAFIGVPGLAGITGIANGAASAFSTASIFSDIGKGISDKTQELIEGPGKAWNNFSGAIGGLTDKAKSSVTDSTTRWLDLISEVFLRSVVVITGFIFVAAGLYMFNRSGGGQVIVNQSARGAKSLAKKLTLN